MKWYVFQDPGGQDWYVQAANPEAALTIAKQRLAGRGYGATDIQATQINGEVPNFDPSDPAVGGRVYLASGVITASTKTKPSTPARNGYEWTLGADGEWTETPVYNATGNEYIGEETALGRRASFQRALAARGRPTSGFAGEYYQDQYDPYESAFQGELATNIGGIGSQHDPQVGNQQLFSKYIGQNNNPYGAILNQFRTLQGLGAGGSNEFANRLTTPDESSLSDSQGFFQNALRARLGGYAASLLSPSLGRASVGYAGQPVATNGAPNQQQNYLEFMRQRLGLGGVNF